MIFGSIVKHCRDHHLFGHRERNLPCLAHHQRCDAEKVSDVGNISFLAPLDVEHTRIVDCARKPAAQIELAGPIRPLALCFQMSLRP